MGCRDSHQRFKMFTTTLEGPQPGGWPCTHPLQVLSSPIDRDRTAVFHYLFRDVCVDSMWTFGFEIGRSRLYREHVDPSGLTWPADETVFWVGADLVAARHPNPDFSIYAPQLNNLDVVAYESLLVGRFSIWQGTPNSVTSHMGIRKPNKVLLGFSRDGFHWNRPDRRPFLGANETDGAWNWGNV